MNKLEKFDLSKYITQFDYLNSLIGDNEIIRLVIEKYDLILERFREEEFLECKNNGEYDYKELIKRVLINYFEIDKNGLLDDIGDDFESKMMVDLKIDSKK